MLLCLLKLSLRSVNLFSYWSPEQHYGRWEICSCTFSWKKKTFPTEPFILWWWNLEYSLFGPPPPQFSLHKRAALSSNSNGTRSVYSRENPKQSLYCEMSVTRTHSTCTSTYSTVPIQYSTPKISWHFKFSHLYLFECDVLIHAEVYIPC
jgi:hypothetical protein